ncbi:Peroxisomal targeting signal 1 receptor [Orchesella cincta]|uniref:Peroxisomal targeting signal 1 receptor n=1 Tax=Orchesella cincta TaxID=48709 RepID=A0A1D2NHA3_ORCCI|nr:Peroxisomal targeting signal 1 receptor [Orchesella cincta]
MSMKELLSSDCGQLNPVLQVASHFTGPGTSGGDGGAVGPSHLVGRPNQNYSAPLNEIGGPAEALLPPTTFRMDSLLKEIQSLDRTQGPTQAPRVVDLTSNAEWVQEFRSSDLVANHGMDQRWAEEFHTNGTLDFDRAWEDPTISFQPPVMHPSYLAQMPPISSHVQDPVLDNAKDLLEDSKWTHEYDQQSKTELMTTAEEFLSSITDPQIKATEFMTFVEKLSTGETSLTQSDRQESRLNNWLNEYETEAAGTSSEIWSQEFGSAVDGDSESMTPNERQEFWQKLQNEWDKVAEESGHHPWLSDISQQYEEAYHFEEENPYREADDPLEEGKRRLAASEIPHAALLFEAAVQADPTSPEAWYLLGTTQALNEQDPQAISALSKCLEIQPDNLKALMALAASLTNESYHLQACRTLQNWLKQNPKYSDLVPDHIEKPSPTASILPSNELASVQNLYIKAARKSPMQDLDPDVQCGLGILFNLSSDYEKAADCFQSAVSADPNNALLWNRLGATMANGGKSAESIGAYSKALEIIPGFIRTRYNLGIACVNLEAYKEAAEHFLSALNMQATSKSALSRENFKNNMSDSIWTSLRMVLHLLDKGKLSSAVDRRDLGLLNQEFGVA